MNWDDVNVLRNLPDGWYSVPSDSEYGKMINKDEDIKYNDSVERAKERHERVLKREREMDDFIKSEKLRDKSKICTHKNFSYKGYLICEVCGLTEQGFDPYASKKKEFMTKMCDKARDIFKRLTSNLDIGQRVDLDELLEVYKTYVLADGYDSRRNFRVSASPEGLCAALLWRYFRINEVRMKISDFVDTVDVRSSKLNILKIFRELDDFEDFRVRPETCVRERERKNFFAEIGLGVIDTKQKIRNDRNVKTV